jgi:GNAT superfamily N-acetyltransferase
VDIARLASNERAEAVDDLAALLKACVDAGASVNFLRPLAIEDARRYWADALGDPDALTLVARDGERIVGTVRLLPATQPNGPHRAEVSKLLVHPDVRGRGIAEALMRALDHVAFELGRTTLVLDTETGCQAERLYTRWGWQTVGVIPDFALTTDGDLGSTTVMTKRLTGLPLTP